MTDFIGSTHCDYTHIISQFKSAGKLQCRYSWSKI